MPPSSAQTSTIGEMNCASTSPEETVFATAWPASAPIRLVIAAIAMACRGVITFVPTTVAIEFAVSWKPLMYSNTRAMKITKKIIPRLMRFQTQEFFRTICETTLAASRQRSMTFSSRS